MNWWWMESAPNSPIIHLDKPTHVNKEQRDKIQVNFETTWWFFSNSKAALSTTTSTIKVVSNELAVNGNDFILHPLTWPRQVRATRDKKLKVDLESTWFHVSFQKQPCARRDLQNKTHIFEFVGTMGQPLRCVTWNNVNGLFVSVEFSVCKFIEFRDY